MENKQHTPLPWSINVTDKAVYIDSHAGQAVIATMWQRWEREYEFWDAQFIVQACNEYEALLERVRRLEAAVQLGIAQLEEYADDDYTAHCDGGMGCYSHPYEVIAPTVARMKAALGVENATSQA